MLPTIVKANHGSGQVVRLKCWTAVPGSGPIGKRDFFFLPAGYVRNEWPAVPKIALRFLRLFFSWFVYPQLSRAQ